MGDWIGLGIIVFVLAGGFWGLSHLGRTRERISGEEFERRVQDARGTTGGAAVLYALQKLMNPKAAEAIEVQKDLKAGHYDDRQETGEGDAPEPDKEANG